jgi:excisionase family DNA binding protein
MRIPPTPNPNASPPRLLLTLSEAGQALNISRTMLYRPIAAGRLRVVKIGASVRLRPDEVERFAAELPSGKAKPAVDPANPHHYAERDER